jgi:hypothetical protein
MIAVLYFCTVFILLFYFYPELCSKENSPLFYCKMFTMSWLLSCSLLLLSCFPFYPELCSKEFSLSCLLFSNFSLFSFELFSIDKNVLLFVLSVVVSALLFFSEPYKWHVCCLALFLLFSVYFLLFSYLIFVYSWTLLKGIFSSLCAGAKLNFASFFPLFLKFPSTECGGRKPWEKLLLEGYHIHSNLTVKGQFHRIVQNTGVVPSMGTAPSSGNGAGSGTVPELICYQ